MKRILQYFLLMTFICSVAGCSKDEGHDDIKEGIPVRKVTCTVNDEQQDYILRGDAEWDEFIFKMFDNVDAGCIVSFQCTSTQYESMDADPKRPLTLKTGDRREAEKWASERGKEGYVVIVSYDKKNKVYKCQALKK